jgi:hypothetical protein
MAHLMALVLLASCAPTVLPAGRSNAASDLAGRVAGPPRNCINIPQGEHLIPLDEATLGYRDRKTLWVTHPHGPCRGLEGINTLVFEQSGTQVCRGDHVRVIDRPLTVPGPVCTLGDFTPYRKR